MFMQKQQLSKKANIETLPGLVIKPGNSRTQSGMLPATDITKCLD